MYAAHTNTNPEVITALLKAGADPEAHDRTARLLLMAAAFNNPKRHRRLFECSKKRSTE